MELQEHAAPECPAYVKTLEMLNERTQLPAPSWHSVFTGPLAALLVCQGAAGVGLPPARAQPTASAHGE